MNFIQNGLTRALANKHTTGAAGVFVVVSGIAKIGAVWFPTHADQFNQTADIIKDAALAYGLVMAGDSQPQNGVDTPPAPDNTPKP